MNRTSAKLQELKNMMKLLESLNLQYTKNKQFYEEDLFILHNQVNQHEHLVERDREQYQMILGIHQKVNSSLTSLLTIYRTINLDILKCQCFLERIPATPELLFV